MSKAFTKEPDGGLEELGEEPEAPEPVPSGTLYITKLGYRRMAAELDHLWRTERPKVTAEVEAAAALGDRSENAEYIYGKKRLREIDRRLRFLKKRLERLTVVDTVPEDKGKVFFGAYVTVEDEDGKQATYRIVGPDETDMQRRWISIDSPMGKAVIGKRTGDVVLVQRPKGEVDLEIMAIRYEV